MSCVAGDEGSDPVVQGLQRVFGLRDDQGPAQLRLVRRLLLHQERVSHPHLDPRQLPARHLLRKYTTTSAQHLHSHLTKDE